MKRTVNSIGTRSPLSFACILAVSLVSAIAPVPPASAAVVTDRPLLFSFDGSDTTSGHLVDPRKLAIDNSTGYVYVAEGDAAGVKNAVSKFNPGGTAATFSATGTSSLFGPPGGEFSYRAGVAVDNSGGPNQGRLYVTDLLGKTLIAFAPDGAFLWEADLGFRPEDVAVDSAGHPWVLNFDTGQITEYANSGIPPAPIGSFSASGDFPRALDVDANGNVYTGSFSGTRKYVGGVLDSTLDPKGIDVFADQSSPSGHIFTVHWDSGDFSEYDSSGALVGTFGKDAIDAGRGIAYNPALDRVYVANDGLDIVEAFGPPTTGTVPDPAIEATVVSGSGTATFHGTINPQSVANAYYFEWVGGVEHSPFNNENGRLFRSPLQSLPEDSSPHAVQYKATNVSGMVSESTPWRVRLVTVNTDSGLRKVSGIDTFKPPKASAGPTVTIAEPSAITTSAAHVSGTVNPKEDSVDLWVETSKGLGCASGSFSGERHYVPGGEINTPIPVQYDLAKLTPAEHYCVRLRAINSFDSSGVLSETKEFDTLPLPPSEVSTAFAAPRTDTSAQINGRVNPEGGGFKYQFEWSEDGASWTQLPLRESSSHERDAIVVADQLTGLKPDTTYHYRLALAENATGPAASSGVEKTFKTRTSAEMVLPQRGIELVNNPDTGNQNVVMEQNAHFSFLSADGEEALWSVPGGAPGSNSGTLAQFLAERTASGWQSRSVAPPAVQQIGEGALQYELGAAVPDFSHFVASVHPANVASPVHESTLASLDDRQNQNELKTYSWSEKEEGLGGVDMTSDGAHVLAVDTASKQLEDIGGGSAEVVSLMPDGTPSSCGLSTETNPGFFGYSGQWRIGYHMMATTDASLVYFRAKPPGECSAQLGLYVRDRETEETTLIAPGVEGKDVEFIRASANGRVAFFTTAGKLDPADTNFGVDLYRWDQDSGESSCLTCVVADAGLTPGAPVLVSDDLSHAYFQSTERLVAGEGVAGKRNVYALSDGEIRFVAMPSVTGTLLGSNGARLSADGNVLVFSSEPSPRLTADQVGCSGPECMQLYRYDDRDGSLECISCLRGSVTAHTFGLGGSLSGEFDMSADGATVAFATEEDLVALDVNHALDIYQWRGGSLGLLTDGVSEVSRAGAFSRGVWGIDADGSNILFGFAEPGLTGFEQNRLFNLYDARIGGGFEPPSPPVHCSGDACQGPLVAAPSAGHTASSAFSGYGNQKSGAKPRKSPCAKKRGKAKRRCVRKHKRRAPKTKAHRNAGRTK